MVLRDAFYLREKMFMRALFFWINELYLGEFDVI